MSRILEITVLSLGGLCLFAVSFLGFALSAGVPLRDVAVVGSLLERIQPEPAEVAVDPAPAPPEPAKSDEEIVQDHLALLSLWSLEPPYEPEELEALVDRLRAKEQELDRRLEEAAETEAYLKDKSAALSEQHATLEEIRSQLEAYDAELRLREAEVRRDEDASRKRDQAGWSETAKLFQEGDPDDLAGRLQQFPPDEAAKILRALGDARARELLDALPDEQWKSYAQAYTRTTP